jgi:hypothetical protein
MLTKRDSSHNQNRRFPRSSLPDKVLDGEWNSIHAEGKITIALCYIVLQVFPN